MACCNHHCGLEAVGLGDSEGAEHSWRKFRQQLRQTPEVRYIAPNRRELRRHPAGPPPSTTLTCGE